jgi:hypothetical protein
MVEPLRFPTIGDPSFHQPRVDANGAAINWKLQHYGAATCIWQVMYDAFSGHRSQEYTVSSGVSTRRGCISLLGVASPDENLPVSAGDSAFAPTLDLS